MDMVMPQISTVQPQATSTGSSQTAGASSNGAAFQQTLVQQINGGTTSSSGQAQTVQTAAVAANAELALAEEANTLPDLAELLAIIDGLIDQLDASSNDNTDELTGNEQELEDLIAALDQMTALLALLGAPLITSQPTAQVSAEGGSETADSHISQAAGLRSSLQDTLLQLQAMLQQGNLKRVEQQDPLLFVQKQLQVLTAIMDGEPVDTNKAQTKSAAFSQQLFTAQSAPQVEVSTLLQRLSQQAVHPSYLATAVISQDQTLAGDTAGAQLDVLPQLQPETNQAGILRGFTQPTASTTGAATTFIMADEFAESMTGLIVQKFDISTLNGVSEAKLKLFPEQLGQVDVRITMQNGLLTAIFQTDTAMAKDALDNQMAQLRAALLAQGLNVDKLEVSQSQSAAQLTHQQHGHGGSQQQEASRQSSQGEGSATDAQLESEIIEQAAVQGLGFGRGINVTA